MSSGRVTQSPLEVLVEPSTQKARVTQVVLEVLVCSDCPSPTPAAVSCTTVVSGQVAASYYIRLKDQSGVQVALFDNWEVLDFSKTVNDVYSYSLSFVDDGDARFDLFELDGQIEIWRSIPGTQDWYLEFEGFHRKEERATGKDGKQLFVSTGVGYNDLLARTIIAYKAGTVRADKSDVAETVMKEYVDENCTGVGDLTTVGRLNYDSDAGVLLYSADLPGLSIQADTGLGVIWSGSRPFENLLDVLQDIANFANIDFLILGTGPATFVFRTYVDQLGDDRSDVGLDSSTGLNGAGNVPVTFSVLIGNVQNISYVLDRLSESNAVVVTGKSELSTIETETRRDNTAIDDSPWNRRETSRSSPISEFDYQLQAYGDEVLQELQTKEEFEFSPLQQPNALYGVDYFLGDLVTAVYGSVKRNKRIVGVKINVKASKSESISMSLADIPT